MRTFIFFLTLTYTLLATSSVPTSIQQHLCKALAKGDNRCENGSVLQYSVHHIMQNDNILFFIYLAPIGSKGNFPVTKKALMVDKKGKWYQTTGENSIRQDIETLSQSPNGTLWVRSHWQSEGVYPAFYHSSDGTRWKRTALPKDREVDCCFERVKKPCFQEKHITLTFKNMKNLSEKEITKSWRSTYTSAESNQPIWKPTTNTPKGCTAPLTNNSWKIEKKYETISFTHKKTKTKITLPYTPDKPTYSYHIQVGAFKYQKSLNSVRNLLNKISHDHQLIRKEVKVNNQTYTKLLIGNYYSEQKAKTVLKKLQKEYPNNQYIQKAFVISLTK
ncbi:MAG: SPOR domain-containing protein [Epsilonproteobacteria bacterium]|nr:SPOR domain-containing protein [Campylobacterota bacterium]